MKKKKYLYISALFVLAGCGGGGGDPDPVVAQAPSVGGVITQPPTIPPAPPPPPTTMPPGTPAPPPVTGPINLPGTPVPLPPAPAPPPATGSSSTDYSWMSDEKESIVVALADVNNNSILVSQSNVMPSIEERRQEIQRQMEAERLAMEQYHKKRMDELMEVEIRNKAIQDKLQDNVSLNWLGMRDDLSVLNFDRINPPGEEALPCDYSHMAFIKDAYKGNVNVGEVIDWSVVSKPENNYKGWFFVLSPFVYSEDLNYFKAIEGQTHLLWARRISEKELVVKPAGSPWDKPGYFKTSDGGYRNIRIRYDDVALPVLELSRLNLKPMIRIEGEFCPIKGQ